MCLTYQKDLHTTGTGWKVVHSTEDRDIFETPTQNNWYSYNKVIVDLNHLVETKLKDAYEKEYPLGFHIFEKKADAKFANQTWYWNRGRVVRVAYSDVVATGVQESNYETMQPMNVVVAKQMYVYRPGIIGLIQRLFKGKPRWETL